MRIKTRIVRVRRGDGHFTETRLGELGKVLENWRKRGEKIIEVKILSVYR